MLASLLINKPLRVAAKLEDNSPKNKMNSWPKSVDSRATMEFQGQYFKPGALSKLKMGFIIP